MAKTNNVSLISNHPLTVTLCFGYTYLFNITQQALCFSASYFVSLPLPAMPSLFISTCQILTNSQKQLRGSSVICSMKPSFWLFFLQSNMIFPTLNAVGINLWILCCFHCPFECKLIELGRASYLVSHLPQSYLSIMPEIYLAGSKIFIYLRTKKNHKNP